MLSQNILTTLQCYWYYHHAFVLPNIALSIFVKLGFFHNQSQQYYPRGFRTSELETQLLCLIHCRNPQFHSGFRTSELDTQLLCLIHCRIPQFHRIPLTTISLNLCCSPHLVDGTTTLTGSKCIYKFIN